MLVGLFLILLMTPAGEVSPGASAVYVPASLLAQNQSSITGFVYSPTRRPLENLRVELLNEVDGVLASTRTNGAGQYAFYRLSSGVFQVKVWATGTDFEGQTQRVALTGSFGGRAGQSEHVDIILTPRRGRGNTGAATISGPGSVFVQEVPSNARLVYEQALKDLENDKSKDKAMEGLLRAVELFPNYFAALEVLGHQYVMRQNFPAAQLVLAKAVSVNPRSGSSWYTLGYSQYKLRALPDAAESLARAASLNNDSLNAHLVLGTVQRLQKVWVPAETHLKQAKSLSKAPLPEVHWQLALLYNQTGRAAAAASELELFLQAQPDSRDAEKIRKLISELRKKK